MALQSSFYTTDGTTRTYPSTKHIATKQHVAVYGKRVSDSQWEVFAVGLYELVNNSVVFDIAPDNVIYSQLEVRVADTADELEDSPSDISLVAGAILDVSTVATNIADVSVLSDNIGSITTVSGSIANVNAVSGSIANVNSVATTVVPNIAEILLADDNAAIATAAATSASDSATSALNSLNEFKGIYHGSLSTPPATSDVGDLYFNNVLNAMYVKSAGGWIPSVAPATTSSTETLFTISSVGQTLNVTYMVGIVDVYWNGIRLANGIDYIATDGTTISPAAGLSYTWDVGDSVLVVAYSIDLSDVYTTSEVDTLLSGKADSNLFTSGSYLPSALSLSSGVVGVSSLTGLYSRVDDVVTVNAYFLLSTMNTNPAYFTLTLPIASNIISANGDVIGVGNGIYSGASMTNVYCYGNSTLDGAFVYFYPPAATTYTIRVQFSYKIQ